MNAIRALRALGPIDARGIQRDSFLRWAVLLPLVMALIPRWIVPWISAYLLETLQFDLTPYYPAIMTYFFVMAAPILYGMVIGFLLLDEHDDQTLTALQVTPLPLSSYLTYRVAIPVALSIIITMAIFPIMGLSRIGFGELLIVALVAAPLAPIFALFLASFAGNKVQGFALMKGAGVLLMAPLAAFFVTSAWGYLFAVVPTYWPMKVYWMFEAGQPAAWIFAALGVAVQSLCILFLLRRFHRQMHR
jgi:fluoroquinolone transport system permease protein